MSGKWGPGTVSWGEREQEHGRANAWGLHGGQRPIWGTGAEMVMAKENVPMYNVMQTIGEKIV